MAFCGRFRGIDLTYSMICEIAITFGCVLFVIGRISPGPFLLKPNMVLWTKIRTFFRQAGIWRFSYVHICTGNEFARFDCTSTMLTCHATLLKCNFRKKLISSRRMPRLAVWVVCRKIIKVGFKSSTLINMYWVGSNYNHKSPNGKWTESLDVPGIRWPAIELCWWEVDVLTHLTA